MPPVHIHKPAMGIHRLPQPSVTPAPRLCPETIVKAYSTLWLSSFGTFVVACVSAETVGLDDLSGHVGLDGLSGRLG